jgi:prophage regulatory protein
MRAKPKPARPIPDNERIITLKEVCERIPLTRQSIWRMARDGRFPPPIRLTASRVGWRLSLILAWIADRESNPPAPRKYF